MKPTRSQKRTVTTLRYSRLAGSGPKDALAHFYLSDAVTPSPQAARKFLTPATLPTLRRLRARLAGLPVWGEQAIEQTFADLVQEERLTLGQIAQPVRVALTGGTASPGIFEVMAVLGKERTLARLDSALAASGDAPPRPAILTS